MKLTDRLRSASKSAHSLSDALVNARLVVLFTDRILYARALACFYFVFKALEDALDKAFDKDAGKHRVCPGQGDMHGEMSVRRTNRSSGAHGRWHSLRTQASLWPSSSAHGHEARGAPYTLPGGQDCHQQEGGKEGMHACMPHGEAGPREAQSTCEH